MLLAWIGPKPEGNLVRARVSLQAVGSVGWMRSFRRPKNSLRIADLAMQERF
jgi:hypothetical protein